MRTRTSAQGPQAAAKEVARRRNDHRDNLIEAKPRWANKKRLALLLRQQLDDGSRRRERGGNAGECRHGRVDSLSRVPKSNGHCVGARVQGTHQHGHEQ